jgi:hypothetical protein
VDITFTNSPASTPDAPFNGTTTITVGPAGVYRISFGANTTEAGAAKKELTVAVNGTRIPNGEYHQQIPAGSFQMFGEYVVTLPAGALVTLQNTDPVNSLTISGTSLAQTSAYLTVIRIA